MAMPDRRSELTVKTPMPDKIFQTFPAFWHLQEVGTQAAIIL
jgi:hypothetical protein